MVQINKLFSELVNQILPAKNKKKNQMIIYYIRLYTDLIHAANYLKKDTYKKTIEYLKIVRRYSKESEFKEEEPYTKRIYYLASSILSNVRCTRCKGLDCCNCNPAHAKGKIQLAQNICILRILRINMD